MRAWHRNTIYLHSYIYLTRSFDDFHFVSLLCWRDLCCNYWNLAVTLDASITVTDISIKTQEGYFEIFVEKFPYCCKHRMTKLWRSQRKILGMFSGSPLKKVFSEEFQIWRKECRVSWWLWVCGLLTVECSPKCQE